LPLSLRHIQAEELSQDAASNAQTPEQALFSLYYKVNENFWVYLRKQGHGYSR